MAVLYQLDWRMTLGWLFTAAALAYGLFALFCLIREARRPKASNRELSARTLAILARALALVFLASSVWALVRGISIEERAPFFGLGLSANLITFAGFLTISTNYPRHVKGGIVCAFTGLLLLATALIGQRLTG